MGEKNKKKPTLRRPGIRRLLVIAGWAVGLSVWLAAAVFVMYQAFSRFERQSSLQEALTISNRDVAAAEAVIAQRETALRDWAYALRNARNTESSDILQAVAQGCQLMDAKQLYLVDDGGLYYGSNGIISQSPLYEGIFSQMQSETVTLQRGGSLVVCLRISPFTVDGSSFCWAAAEFAPTHYQRSLVPNLRRGQTGAQILDSSGEELLRLFGERNLFPMLDTLAFDGYDSPADLKKQILALQQVEALCRIGGKQYLLIADPFPERDWILLTLDPMPTPPSLLEPVMLLYMATALLLGLAAPYIWYLRRQGKSLRRKIQAATESTEQLQVSLDAAIKDNSIQREFMDTISHNIRTPLNGIVGFTALAKRHIQEPQAVQEYLDKVGDACGQLLSKLNEGLDATSWHRYVEEEDRTQELSPSVNLEGKRILVVEDNALNRDIDEAVLTELGILVEFAVNGEEGFQKVAASRPGYYDLVLMDIQMPVMDGYTSTKMIRRLRAKMLAEIPILAMTANVAEEVNRKAFEAGMNGYLEKPMNIEKLLTAIHTTLERRVNTDYSTHF